MKNDLMPISLVDEVLVDLTNFLAAPLRTGIQRYFTEIISNWPDGHALLPFALAGEHEIALLNPAIIRSISGYMRAECQSEQDLFAEEIHYFAGIPLSRAGMVDLIGAKAILLPEVTYHAGQLAFYRKALSYFREKVFIVVYDFIPWLRPDLYPELDFGARHLNDYIGLLQKADNFVFISHKSKRDAEQRVLRRDLTNSLVLGGGADGLGASDRVSGPARPACPGFVMVGTVQRRKQHFAVLDVCESLWQEGARFFLTFVGAAGDFLTDEERGRLEALAENSPWFQWEKSPLDSELAEILRQATATIYVSVEEGLGLPVLESLWLSVPVIASATLPVLDFIPARGVRLVDPGRPESLAETIKAFLVPGFAESVLAEIDRNSLPTWRGVAGQLQAWTDPVPAGRISAKRRIEMAAVLRDLRRVPPERLVFEAGLAIVGRAPTGAELSAWFERPDHLAGEASAVLEQVIEAGAASGTLSFAERSAWLMSLEASEALPADFRFAPPAMAKAARIDRGIALLRTLLGCPDERFLDLAYHTILHRPPDPSGEADFRSFLSAHAERTGWARGMAIKSLIQSEEGQALEENKLLDALIEDLLLVDLASEAEASCFRQLADALPSRWLFARLLDLRSEAFMRFSTALVGRRRLSEVEIRAPAEELSREEKLGFLRDLCRDEQSAAHLLGWIGRQQ